MTYCIGWKSAQHDRSWDSEPSCMAFGQEEIRDREQGKGREEDVYTVKN